MFEPYRCFDALVEGWDLVSAQVEPDGETATLLLRRPNCWYPYDARVVFVTESGEWEIDFPDMDRVFKFACRLGDDRLLFWHGNGNPNAAIYDLDGRRLHEFWLGDYWEHVQVDRQQRIWVAYFDQGYAKPMSEYTLSCFDSGGNHLRPWWSPLNCMDMYAMNVSKDAIWLNCAPYFPIARLDYDGRVREWYPPVHGARALVARGQRVALFGAYPPNRYQWTLVELEGGKAKVISQGEALLPNGRGPGWTVGRGGYFHTFEGNVWYRLGII